MLVAISFSTGLYLAALYLHPRKAGRAGKQSDSGLLLLSCLGLSLFTIYRIPAVSGTPQFLSTLLWMHVFLLLPFIPIPSLISGKASTRQITAEDDKAEDRSFRLSDQTVYISILMPAFLIALTNTVTLAKTILSGPINPSTSGYRYLFNQAFSHPAQGSISMDVIWSAITLGIWYLVNGSFGSTVMKSLVIAGYGSYALAKHYGVNWTVVLSAVPIFALLSFGVAYLALARARSKNVGRRKEMMESMGIKENVVIPGAKGRAPSKAGRKLVVGFWHPYWLVTLCI
jgi:alpha-1,2-mannosyltransferase